MQLSSNFIKTHTVHVHVYIHVHTCTCTCVHTCRYNVMYMCIYRYMDMYPCLQGQLSTHRLVEYMCMLQFILPFKPLLSSTQLGHITPGDPPTHMYMYIHPWRIYMYCTCIQACPNEQVSSPCTGPSMPFSGSAKGPTANELRKSAARQPVRMI